jgi:hypothetical protein
MVISKNKDRTVTAFFDNGYVVISEKEMHLFPGYSKRKAVEDRIALTPEELAAIAIEFPVRIEK